MLRFKNKDTLLEEEFLSLDVRLRIEVYALASFIQHRFKKDVIVTSVYRGRDKTSTHAFWRGVDLRVTPGGGEPIYTKRELDQIKAFCIHFEYSPYPDKKKYKTIKIHDTGGGLHIHMQVNGGSITRIVR